MKIKTIEILKKAMAENIAVGAFNTSNLEVSQAIVRGAKELNLPCIIQATTSTFDFIGKEIFGKMIEIVIEEESNSTPIGFHLDHGKKFDDIMNAIEIGMDSVMIDGSKLSFKENLALSKKVVAYAHSKGVSVQAELGAVPYLGREESEVDWNEIMTNPNEAKILAEEANIDALAVGIGNAHGFFKERTRPDWARLKEIKRLLPETPLILHGASDWDEEKIRRAISEGICCFNIDTDLRMAFIKAICNQVSPRCDIVDPRKIMIEVRKKIQEKVMEKIKLFAGKL